MRDVAPLQTFICHMRRILGINREKAAQGGCAAAVKEFKTYLYMGEQNCKQLINYTQ